MLHCGHIHQIPSRKSDIGGNSRPFSVHRLLIHLDQNLLPLFEQVRDGRYFPLLFEISPPFLHRGHFLSLLTIQEFFIILQMVRYIRHVKKGVSLQANVHKGSLHSRKYTVHPSFIYVAQDVSFSLSLNK